jgi:hypothetical protein
MCVNCPAEYSALSIWRMRSVPASMCGLMSKPSFSLLPLSVRTVSSKMNSAARSPR